MESPSTQFADGAYRVMFQTKRPGGTSADSLLTLSNYVVVAVGLDGAVIDARRAERISTDSHIDGSPNLWDDGDRAYTIWSDVGSFDLSRSQMSGSGETYHYSIRSSSEANQMRQNVSASGLPNARSSSNSEGQCLVLTHTVNGVIRSVTVLVCWSCNSDSSVSCGGGGPGGNEQPEAQDYFSWKLSPQSSLNSELEYNYTSGSGFDNVEGDAVYHVYPFASSAVTKLSGLWERVSASLATVSAVARWNNAEIWRESDRSISPHGGQGAYASVSGAYGYVHDVTTSEVHYLHSDHMGEIGIMGAEESSRQVKTAARTFPRWSR